MSFQQETLVDIESLPLRKRKKLACHVRTLYKNGHRAVDAVSGNRYLEKKYASLYDCRKTVLCRASGGGKIRPCPARPYPLYSGKTIAAGGAIPVPVTTLYTSDREAACMGIKEYRRAGYEHNLTRYGRV